MLPVQVLRILTIASIGRNVNGTMAGETAEAPRFARLMSHHYDGRHA